MSELDYAKLKFMAGLEVHQQLDSRKLFCNCPSILRKDEPDFVVERKLHAVAGESGEVDIAALHQASLDKQFVYQGYDTTCLVELDEEPPHEINKEALETALHIAMLLNCKIVPVTQIMRKTVVDGSNTSGFQRTVLIARDGYLETKEGRVGINYIYLEEDAARIVSREKDKETYKLDRLGIPLVEVVTAPDVKTPEQAKEVALQIGDVLRSCKVRRGIGTIRQDVNVSIRKDNRVEIKGMQDMKIFVKAIEKEVERQKELSDAKKFIEMEVRNVLPDASTEFMRPLPGSARMYPETDLPLLKISRKFIDDAKKNLPQMKGEIESGLKEKGLNEDMIKLLLKRNKVEDFKVLLKVLDKPSLIAKMILIFPKEIAAKTKKSLEDVEDIVEDFYSDILNKLIKEKISESDIKDVMINLVSGKDLDGSIVSEKADSGDVEEKVMKMIKEKPGLSANAYMGLVMKEYAGRINGNEVMKLINKFLS